MILIGIRQSINPYALYKVYELWRFLDFFMYSLLISKLSVTVIKKPMTKNLIAFIEGNIGSGKSTVVRSL